MHPAADKLNDRSMSHVLGNLYSCFGGGLLAVVSVRLHFYIYGTTPKEWLQTLGIAEVLGWLFVSVLAHEGIHGLAWKLSNIRNPDIRIQFGFSWKACAFFARAIGSMPIRSYIFGAGAPGVLLGILPVAVGLLTGYIPLTIFGSLNIAGAGGDFIVLWLTRKVSKNSWVIDHPTRLGFMIIEAAPSAVVSPVTSPLRT